MKTGFSKRCLTLNHSKIFQGKVCSLLPKLFARVFENAFYVSREMFWRKQLYIVFLLFPNNFGYFRTQLYLIFGRWAKAFSHSVWKLSVVGRICNLHVQRRRLSKIGFWKGKYCPQLFRTSKKYFAAFPVKFSGLWLGLSKKRSWGEQVEILRTFVWRNCKIINTGHWCRTFPLFAWTFSVGLWKRPLRVDRNTLVKLFSFRKKSTFCQCGHRWTLFWFLTEVLRRGCKNCIRRFQTLKILL